MPKNNSRKITEAQQDIHKNLLSIVKKHIENPFQKPIAEHTLLAFKQLKPTVEKGFQNGQSLILDSCCGTAMSTAILAEENPEAMVVGIDRSATRLGKEYNRSLPDNAIIVQAECGDFWQLALAEGWKPARHMIYYPNPYPKSKHLKRRWHGHPAFPALLALGGEIELRTNWKVYADEFCAAINQAKQGECDSCEVESFQADKPMTLFEKKYQEAGQELYRCKIRL